MPKKKETREEALARLKREAAGTPLYKGKAKGTAPKKPKVPTKQQIRAARAAALRAKFEPSGIQALNRALNPPKKKED